MPEQKTTLRSLAPQPGLGAERGAAVVVVQTYSNAKWESLRPEIERLWVQERRKLKHIMAYMRQQHNFNAS
jgi:hypothetical protein